MQIDVEIINDNQWEPDEEFFLKISLLMDQEKREGVQLGRITIMEITILNDDGEYIGQKVGWGIGGVMAHLRMKTDLHIFHEVLIGDVTFWWRNTVELKIPLCSKLCVLDYEKKCLQAVASVIYS